MAENNARQAEEFGTTDVERKLDKSGGSRLRDQRALKVKDKSEEDRLPTPPPDPQCSRLARDRSAMSRDAGGREEDEEDLTAYLNELSTSPFEGHSFDYDAPNSAASTMAVATGPFAEEAFEHLDRLCSLTEQILELRDRSSRYFRRVRGLERAKALRNADRRLETALATDEELGDFPDEDTGFAESLLDAMLSNCRQDPTAQRRNERASVRSPSSRQRSRSLALAEQTLPGASSVVDRTETDKRTARNGRNGGPKISKWTRVKAAFKWERACTSDLAEIAESSAITSTTRYLKIPETVGGSWSGSTLSPCTSEVSSPSTPIGRVSPTSSFNEEVFDDTRKNTNYSDRQLPQAKDNKKKDDSNRCDRFFDRDTSIAENANSIEFLSEQVNRDKPLIRTSDTASRTTSGSGKDSEISSKRPTPTLTITIPSNEEEIRSLSSPESMSPLLSSAQDSGGSSPQRPKTRQDISSPREFKRQYSTIEETVTPAPKIQRQDSKWNKVRRAFLTNATFSVPPSPVRIVAAQSFTNDGTAGHCRAEALRDYQALREKFGSEFHRKLVEWERLKNGSPRAMTARNTRDYPLNEERLASEFRKKLQDWKRAKKGRRPGASSIEQQHRVSRRRLTDWQLWRSSSKPEPRCYGKNQNFIGFGGSCASIGSAGSFGSDGKQHLCEDFVKRMEAWRRMSEVACRGNEKPKQAANRVASDIIDETEFFALEKSLLLFGQRSKKEHRESDAKQLNDCFDGDSRFTVASRGINCGNEVLIRTSVGSYRFEGISREFTRKLYDWEKYRGISPRSSTFRLLGPGYTPFAQDSDEVTESTNTTGKNRAFHRSLKRSKSDGSIFEGNLRDESYTLRRSTSLSLSSADKLEDDNQMDTLPASNNARCLKDPSEDTAVEDSEPEAMIVDIEDVIEETASPLERVQPHQTPVYSVAASETTSIAVPLGTVTSSHEPSPVYLVEAESNDDCERWNCRTLIRPEARSSGNSPSSEYFSGSEDWRERSTFLDDDKPTRWEPLCNEGNKENEASAEWTEKTHRSIPDNDIVKLDRPIGWNRDAWDKSGKIFQRHADEANRDTTELGLIFVPVHKSNTDKTDMKKQDIYDNNNIESTQLEKNSGTSSITWNAEKLMDSPHTSERMKETRKIEDLDESNNEEKNKIDNHQDNLNNEKSGKTVSSTYSHTCQLARKLSSSHCRNSRENSLDLPNLYSDEDKDEVKCHDIENEIPKHYENCNLSELQTDIDRHYEILTFRTDTPSGSTTDDHFLYEPINCHENHNSYDVGNNPNERTGENFSSRLSEIEKSDFSGLLTDPTIRTIPITVSRDNEARRLERILINEETLNKIIVPTMSVESVPKCAEKLQDCFANANRQDETTAIGDRRSDCDHAPTRVSSDHQATCTKKDDSSSSSSRNVFVKTKRKIFGPFRRSEDRSSSRKESDESVNDAPLHCKSKSKSRSASPKLCRQDALLRVSLSLPWPLRSISKESETASEVESRRSSGSKAEDVVTVQKKNSRTESSSGERRNANSRKLSDPLTNEEISSVKVNRRKASQADAKPMIALINTRSATFPQISEQADRSRAASIQLDQSTCALRDEVKCSRMQNEATNNEVKYSSRQDEDEQNDEKCGQKQNQENANDTKCGRGQNEAKPQDENHSRSDSVPSDLMHKLKILSDAAARREGRATPTEVISSSESSRSSRIRRAKQSFLSRRGGPFCRSMMEPVGAANYDPWRMTTRQMSTNAEASRSNEIKEVATLKPEEAKDVMIRTEMATGFAQDQATSSGEDKVDSGREDAEVDVGLRADLVKSASAGMINVDPDTFDRLIATDRGCESLPRTIAKRRDSSGPLAKIVSKLKLSRLIRIKNVNGNNMSTISTLCRQSLLIDTRGRSSTDREDNNDLAEKDDSKNNDESSKIG